MKNLKLFALFLALVGCSKSNPQFVEKVPEVRTEIKEYRVMDESTAVEELISSESESKFIQEVRRGHRTNFSWERFWKGINSKRTLITESKLSGLSELSVYECSTANTESYLFFLENYFSDKTVFNVRDYVSLLKKHFFGCPNQVRKEHLNAMKVRIEEGRKAISESSDSLKEYISILSLVHKRTEFLVIGDPNKIIDGPLFRVALAKSLEGDDLAFFNEASSLLANVYPDQKLSNSLNPGKVKIDAARVEQIMAVNSVSNILGFLDLVARNDKGLVWQKIEDLLKKVHDNKLPEVIQGLSEVLRFYYSLANTKAKKLEVFELANVQIQGLLARHGNTAIDEALREEDLIHGIPHLLKALVTKVQPVTEITSEKGEELDYIAYLMSKLLTEDDMRLSHDLSMKICKSFAEAGIESRGAEEIKASDIGCLDLEKDTYRVKNLTFNLFSIYRRNGKDVQLEGGRVTGGIFDLSSTKVYPDLRIDSPEKYVRSYVISTLLAARDKEGKKTVLIPFCWTYKKPDLDKKFEKLIQPARGINGGKLLVRFTRPDHNPKVISLGSEGQKRPAFSFRAGGKNLEISKDLFAEYTDKLKNVNLLTTIGQNYNYINLLLKDPGILNTNISTFVSFFQKHLLAPNEELQNYIITKGLGCGENLCSVENVNNSLVNEAREMIKKKHLFHGTFSYSCQTEDEEFLINEDDATLSTGLPGGLEKL